MFRVTFTVLGEDYELLCRSIDFEEHPLFVILSDLHFEDQSEIIISPNGDKARRRFGGVNRVRVLSHHVHLIEEIPTEAKKVTTLRSVDG